jgi:hypothetical protein
MAEAKAYHEVAKATPKYYFVLGKWVYFIINYLNNIYLVITNEFNYKKLIEIEKDKMIFICLINIFYLILTSLDS